MTDEIPSELINAGAEVATEVGKKLVTKVSKGIGGLYRPIGLVRMAKAEAKARVLLAKADAEVAEIEQRAMHRLAAEETRRQINFEAITVQALPHLKEDAEPEKMDDDWIASFFEKAKIVSNEDMQSIWARILAGEANAPGTYSKRTLTLLADFDKADADLFSLFCRFCGKFDRLIPLIFDCTDDLYTGAGVTFADLQHLESLGLIQFNSITGFSLKSSGPYQAVIYAGRQIDLMLQAPDHKLDVGQALFTKMGSELASLVDAPELPGFFDYLTSRFAGQGIIRPEIKVNISVVATTLPSGYGNDSPILDGGAISGG
jgi:hypothetical protein